MRVFALSKGPTGDAANAGIHCSNSFARARGLLSATRSWIVRTSRASPTCAYGGSCGQSGQIFCIVLWRFFAVIIAQEGANILYLYYAKRLPRGTLHLRRHYSAQIMATCGSSMCEEIAVTLIALVTVAALVLLPVQFATFDSHPPPTCQHFPLSARCASVDATTCVDECTAPKLSVYIDRRHKADMLANALDYCFLWWSTDWNDDDGDVKEWSEFDLLYHEISAAITLLTPERIYYGECMAACRYARNATNESAI